MKKYLLIIFAIFLFKGIVIAQEKSNLDNVTPGKFDQGKMWTFENPPLDYFDEAYGFRPDQEWMDDVRKSALRFASWCSASFVSESGLIMTNHHCSRGVVASVMKEGENFDDNGFYAQTAADERRIESVYVDQLLMIDDITDQVHKMTNISADSALVLIQQEYANKMGWEGLVLETRTFYSGGKYSLYGFKRYPDIRLVLYPEVAVAYFGGDPDNFTYPRYNLDFTFFRAYDENGIPLKPNNFFEFNYKGAEENELVFIVGNPGSTGRYLTMAQLYYQRDVTAPAVISFLRDRMEILKRYSETVDDVYKKDSVMNMYFSFSNSNKAYTGRLDGFNDPYLMTKKEKKEQEVRSNLQLEGADPWVEIENNANESKNIYAELLFLNPSSTRGKVNQLMHRVFQYDKAMASENETEAPEIRKEIENIFKGFDPVLEKALFSALIEELNQHSRNGYMKSFLGSMSPREKADQVMTTSALFNEKERAKFLGLKANKLAKTSDPLLDMAKMLVPKFEESRTKFGAMNQENSKLQEKIMNLQYQLSGVTSPPDATFSLRIADGRVQGYEYNGTTAPYMTTYFGLYDRYYSNAGEFPWNLPERWMNPPIDLLKAPLDFVCTADIIGGNSGSPVINKKGEVVGLVFDMNIESLPGYFIYDDTYSRTVSVHTGGIAAALKYIYKADRLVKELNID